jgi:hypothetical protein
VEYVYKARRRTAAWAKRESAQQPEPGAPLKALWYAAEAFGDVVGLLRTSPKDTLATPPATALQRQELVESLKEDYAADYFLSATLLLYCFGC